MWTRSQTLAEFGVDAGEYFFATVHRAGNSDNPARLESIIRAFSRLEHPVVWAVHPRTRNNLSTFGLTEMVEKAENIRPVPPVSYMETVALLGASAGLLTDSGGMQKEAYFFGVPCVTLREETEWVETVELGWNALVGSDEEKIVAAAGSVSRPSERPDVYGDGHASEAIVRAIEEEFRLV